MSKFFRRSGSSEIGFEKGGAPTAENLDCVAVGKHSITAMVDRVGYTKLFNARPDLIKSYNRLGENPLSAKEYMRDNNNKFLSHEDIREDRVIQVALRSLLPLDNVTNRNKYSDGVLKRSIDIIGSATALVFLLPLMLAISGLVKANSPGPIFFRQQRRGRDGKPFHILKFRTMVHRRSATPFVQAQRDDARITPLGAVLRRYSLDELPQLINVLKGDMSLIGPRPHAIEHDEEFRVQIPSYDRRYSVRPGITGLAQVNGFRGPTPTVEVMRHRIAHDVCYVQKASLRLDLWIYAATLREVVSSKIAY